MSGFGINWYTWKHSTVMVDAHGAISGVAAVIEKDRAAALLAGQAGTCVSQATSTGGLPLP